MKRIKVVEEKSSKPVMKIVLRGILALFFWLLVALVIQMIAIFLGFLIEDKELPLITAAYGGGLAILIFVVGYGVHLFRLITSLKK